MIHKTYKFHRSDISSFIEQNSRTDLSILICVCIVVTPYTERLLSSYKLKHKNICNGGSFGGGG